MKSRGIDILWPSLLALLLPGTAVQAKQAIVGGEPINIKEAPWQVLLQFRGQGGVSTCGGSWIGGRWIVTAAHCGDRFTLDSMFAYAGISRRTEKSPSNALGIARVIRHPDFPIEWKDIALFELSSDVTAVDARPIRPASPKDVARGLIDPGRAVMATGWGGTNRAMDPADTLQRVMSKVNDTAAYTVTWAGFGDAGNVGACVGDSGGPLAVKDSAGTSWILAGISSKIYSYCGDPKSASSYTRVSAFYDWIQETTGGVSAVQPSQAEAPRIQWLPASGRFHLARPQSLDLTFAAVDGAVIRKSRVHLPAGEHSLSTLQGVNGPHVLRIRGEGLDAYHRGF